MSLSGAVEWWEEWQLRILVLASLFVQWFLFLGAPQRKHAIPSWFRSLIWLAYLGSDALAIYALANLFNRQRRQDCSSGKGNSILEVVWAPVLLMHLGGQDVITAYNIEDNELWTRHVVTAVSQVTVAIYVFSTSWPDEDKRLLQASILFFVPGILKCIEKPWAFKKASINSLVSSSGPATRTTTKEAEINLLEDYVQKARAFVRTDSRRQAQQGDVVDLESNNYLPQAQGEDSHSAMDLETNHQSQAQGEAADVDPEPDHHPQTSRTWRVRLNQIMEKRKSHLNQREPRPRRRDNDYNENEDLEAHRIFVDLASPYPDRLVILNYFWLLDAKQAYNLLQNSLFSMFNLLYTKTKLVRREKGENLSCLGVLSLFIRMSAGLLPWAAIGLFHKSNKEDYDDNDVMVTYALFCCSAVLEYGLYVLAIAPVNVVLNDSLIGQYNLLGFFARNRRYSRKVCILNFFNCKDFLDKHWSMKPCKSSFAITELVLKYVKKGWEDQIKDTDSYWKFNDHRGQWTLQSNNCDPELGCSLRKPFDESVLLWHIATDFCFYYIGASEDHQCATPQRIHDASVEGHGCAVWCEESPHYGRAVRCREMSNYMMYLLFVNPEMLLSGTRRNLFTTANAELEEILKDDDPLLKKTLDAKRPLLKEIEREFMQRVITKVQCTENREQENVEHMDSPPDSERDAATQEGFIIDAWKLANALLHIGDENKTWDAHIYLAPAVAHGDGDLAGEAAEDGAFEWRRKCRRHFIDFPDTWERRHTTTLETPEAT